MITDHPALSCLVLLCVAVVPRAHHPIKLSNAVFPGGSVEWLFQKCDFYFMNHCVSEKIWWEMGFQKIRHSAVDPPRYMDLVPTNETVRERTTGR